MLPLGGTTYPSTLNEAVLQLFVKGRTEVAPTAVTPGSAAIASVARSKYATRTVSLGYLAAGRPMLKVSTLSGRNPGSTCRRRENERVSRPAPTRSVSATATVPITSARRSASPPRSPAAPRPPSFSVSWSDVRDTRSAGARPKSSPVKSDSSSVKPSTLPSMPMAVAGGRLLSLSDSSAGTPQSARRMPSAPPASARRTLSARSCRTRSAGEAPSATRTAISRARDAARASCRLATLAQAMSSTSPTAPRSTNIARRMPGEVTWSLSGVSARSQSSGKASGRSALIRPASACISACAVASVTPSLRRALSARNSLPQELASWPGVKASGVQRSTFRSSIEVNDAGMTPTIS